MNVAPLSLRALAPGLGVAGLVALAASFLGAHYGAPVMLFALLIGIAFNFLSDEGRCVEGIGFAARTLLRLGVALLGARVTVEQIAGIGLPAALGVAGLVGLTIGTGFLIAPLLGRGWRFALLTGGAVAICGASAALALAAVIPPNDKLERNTLFTVIAVTALSTFAMILYPILFAALGFTPVEAGFLVGATIHDVAQVVGAGHSISDEAGEIAAIVKLFRVALLPVVLVLALLALGKRGGSGGAARPPAFLIGFVALAAANSAGIIPGSVSVAFADASRWLFVVAIAALGMKTRLKAIVEVGGGHLGVVMVETLVLLAGAMLLVGLIL